MRIWPVRDRAGAIVPSTYLVAMDYSGINYDYNDNVYLVSNMKPEAPQTLYRLDVGASSNYTDTQGNVWTPDTGFTPSTAPSEGSTTRSSRSRTPTTTTSSSTTEPSSGTSRSTRGFSVQPSGQRRRR